MKNPFLPAAADAADSLLAAIVESSDDAIVSKALDGTILSWNRAAERIFGYKAEEAVGKPISILFPADRLQEEVKLIDQIRRGQRIEHFETVRSRKDGTLVDISLTLSPIRDAQGKVIAASKIARDITAHKQAAHADSLLSAIVGSSDDAIISKDLNGTITSWNKAAERIFGYQASEVVGGPISILIPPERGAEETEILQKISRGERVEHFETERIRKDGGRVDVSVTISPLLQDGRIVGASKVARDITEQKRIERELRQERARLEVTLKSIGDAVIVSDTNGLVKFMNPVAEVLTGWHQDAAHGQSLETVFNVVNERTRRRVENPAGKALREGTIVGLANHSVLVARDGTEYAIDDSAAPVRDQDGDVLGVVLVFRDVSGSRAAEDFRARLASIVQSSEDAIVSKDLNGKITSWNPGAARLFGYTAEEAIGRPISMIIPPERLAEETDIIARIRSGLRIEHFETVRLTKDRRKVDVSISISPVRNAEGQVVGASKIARDITQRKRTEQELAEVRQRLQRYLADLEQTVDARTSQLRAAYRDLEAFTYSVAHDLQAPARRIRSLVTVLEEELGSAVADGPRDVLQKAIMAADRMLKLIQDMLKLSQVGRDPLQYQPTSLGDVVRQAIAELKPQTHGRQVDWRVGELPVVPCDPGLMQQALGNLLSNALKYTRRRAIAEIEVGQRTVDGYIAFYIRDNGVGFESEKASKLFTPFERFHDQAEYEGSGVGLAIVERVIRKHGGRVWAEAEPDRGATFYFTLAEKSPG